MRFKEFQTNQYEKCGVLYHNGTKTHSQQVYIMAYIYNKLEGQHFITQNVSYELKAEPPKRLSRQAEKHPTDTPGEARADKNRK